MTAPIARIARASARELAPTLGSTLSQDIEDLLRARSSGQPPRRYVDGVAVASLVISAATFAWTICKDLLEHRRLRADEVVERVKPQLPPIADVDEETTRTIIVVVVNNAISAAQSRPPD